MQISPGPEPEDYLAATNSYLEIIMYATDDSGLTSTTVRNVYPQLVEVCIDTEPQGLEVYVDEYPIKTPMLITSWVNHDLRLRVETQDEFTFFGWNDAVVLADRDVRLQSTGNSGLLASFCSEGNNTCITEAEARATDNLLVARCVTKAPTASPTALASDAPTAAQTSPPPVEDVEEDFPVDEVAITADGEPIPERPHDIEYPPEEDDHVWDMFEDEYDAAVTVRSPLAIVACSLALFNLLQLIL